MAGWLESAAGELGVPPLTRPEIDALLDVTRDVAHGTERRYAPLTSFLVGLAIGGETQDRGAALDEAIAQLRGLLDDDG